MEPKKIQMQRNSHIIVFHVHVPVCILQNPEKSASLQVRVSPIFWRHSNVVSEAAGCWRCSRFAMMAFDKRKKERRHAMPTKTDEGRKLATYRNYLGSVELMNKHVNMFKKTVYQLVQSLWTITDIIRKKNKIIFHCTWDFFGFGIRSDLVITT